MIGYLGRTLLPLAMATGLGLATTGAHASAPGAFVADLAASPSGGEFIAGGLLWKCQGSTCRTRADGSRPAAVCRQVTRTAGQVSRFASPKGEFSTEDLARCNQT